MLNLEVYGMSCGHCVSTVTKAVQMVPGAENVAVDLARSEVEIRGGANADAVRAAIAITKEGYEVVSG